MLFWINSLLFLPKIIIQCTSSSQSCFKLASFKTYSNIVLTIVSHYNFFHLPLHLSLDSSSPTKATLSTDHLSVFDHRHIVPTSALFRTYVFSHQTSLHMCSACSWWCSHRASVSSVWTRQTLELQWWPGGLAESWASQREGSETPRRAGPPCGSAKAESFRPILG